MTELQLFLRRAEKLRLTILIPNSFTFASCPFGYLVACQRYLQFQIPRFYSRLIHLHLNTCSNRYILPLIFAARWLHSRVFTSPREYREKNPPSVKFPFYLHSESKMDQKLANKLFEDGAFLFILDLPVGTEFGIDLNIWNTGEKFKGVKLIPPGFHFVFYR